MSNSKKPFGVHPTHIKSKKLFGVQFLFTKSQWDVPVPGAGRRKSGSWLVYADHQYVTHGYIYLLFFRFIRLLDYWSTGLLDFWFIRLLDFGLGLLVYWAIGF